MRKKADGMSAMMSQSHMDGFLADIRRANPNFNERAFLGLQTSSLLGLLTHLRASSRNPQRFANAAAALAHCNNPADPRLQKYQGAIRNLVTVWGTGAPYPGQEVAIGRVVFRGDDRQPATIFAAGFQPRQPGPLRFRGAEQDIDPNTAVAVSPRPAVAANFPLPAAYGPGAFQAASGRSYVYACYLERGYNTAGLQGLNFVSGNAAAGNLVYAGEMASSSVPAAHVLGAIEVWRNFIHVPGIFRPRDWIARGVFRFIRNSWQLNPRYTGPAGYGAAVANLFSYELQTFVAPGAPARGPVTG